jgi:hypothetical protein
MFFGTLKSFYLKIRYDGIVIILLTLWTLPIVLFVFKTTFRRLVYASILR